MVYALNEHEQHHVQRSMLSTTIRGGRIPRTRSQNHTKQIRGPGRVLQRKNNGQIKPIIMNRSSSSAPGSQPSSDDPNLANSQSAFEPDALFGESMPL